MNGDFISGPPCPRKKTRRLIEPVEFFSITFFEFWFVLQGLRIGLPREYFGEGLSADVGRAVQAALDEYKKLGATLVDISLPASKLSVPAYYVIAPAEASSNLARFDGVRYGHRAAEYSNLMEMYKKSRAEGF